MVKQDSFERFRKQHLIKSKNQKEEIRIQERAQELRRQMHEGKYKPKCLECLKCGCKLSSLLVDAKGSCLECGSKDKFRTISWDKMLPI